MPHVATPHTSRTRRTRIDIPRDPYTLLGTPELGQLLGVSRETLYRWRIGGRFPAPDLVLPGDRKVWLRSTVEAWLEGGRLKTSRNVP